jgi:hypothetical protein
MRDAVQSFRAQAEEQAKELVHAIAAAEGVIIATIERECEALRAGQMLAADALRIRVNDAARLYLNLTRATRACITTLELVLPGACDHLEERRAAFAAILKVELGVLAAERAAALRPKLAVVDAGGRRPVAPRLVRRRRMARRRAS